MPPTLRVLDSTTLASVRRMVGVFVATLLLLSSCSDQPRSDAIDARNAGRYRDALAKYEIVLAKTLSEMNSGSGKVVNVGVLPNLYFWIAFCYTKLGETESDVSCYADAERAARESYSVASVPTSRANALYLWGYILFRQAQYGEAQAKFTELLSMYLPNRLLEDTWFALGKSHMELGDRASAQEAFGELLSRFPDTTHKSRIDGILGQ